MTLDLAQAVIAGVVLALFVGAGGGMLFVGLRARSEANAVRDGLERVEALVDAAPAQAMLVRVDGRLELSRRLADWLGFGEIPRSFDALIGEEQGIEPEDHARLSEAVTAAQKAAKPFTLTLRPAGSTRVLAIVGQRAPEGARAPGGVALWFFDATDREAVVTAAREAAERLRTAFDALTGLIESAPMPMWYRGPDLRLAMVNTAYVRAVEATNAEDVIARGVELIEGDGLGAPIANAAIARDTGEPQTTAAPATIGGARRTLRLHDVPLATGGVAGFAIDVEELEEARGATKRFADAQRAMLDRLAAGVAQFAPDRSLVFVNQPFRRIFSMRPEWLGGAPEFDRVLERMREANRTPEVRDFPGWKAERRAWFTAADAVEENWHLAGGTHLRVIANPLADGGLLVIFEDRTEQVQLASARDTLLRVRTATFDNLFEALGVFAADGRLQLWNSKFRTLWGIDESKLTAHPHVDAFSKEVRAKLADPSRAGLIGDLVRSAANQRQQRGGQFVFADGRTFEAGAVPLPDGNALFTMLDITDRRRVERALRDRNEALEAADRVKTAFVANMSYELRTPLTSIKGFTELLAAGVAGPLSETGSEYTDAILASVERLGLLVDDVLDLTSGDASALKRERVDLEHVANAAAGALAEQARGKAIDLAVEVHGSAGMVKGDSDRIRQVIEHLLRHAVAGTPEKGRVLLHVDGDDAKARIIVSDDGPGMDEGAVARAFDRFAQPGITRSGERALGLGLPIAKQFVEAHGGTIQLISEPGEGTLVTVELPR